MKELFRLKLYPVNPVYPVKNIYLPNEPKIEQSEILTARRDKPNCNQATMKMQNKANLNDCLTNIRWPNDAKMQNKAKYPHYQTKNRACKKNKPNRYLKVSFRPPSRNPVRRCWTTKIVKRTQIGDSNHEKTKRTQNLCNL